MFPFSINGMYSFFSPFLNTHFLTKPNHRPIRAKALTKDSIVLLLDMISKHNVITSKSTNATNNKLKEEAWKSIAQELSALTGEIRRPEQLRLKWENLKKAARKRSALIRQNNLKTGGGKAFIPPDEVLERVASILGATCTGLSVVFGGDGENESVALSEAVVEVQDLQPLPELPQDSTFVVLGADGSLEAGGGSEAYLTPKKFIFNTPSKGSKW
ncbi:unnamed protein product [Diatraea saccharalis]|uniref:Regulatory protein zeste n=1 Tax=Diatraea saccharalis TaxID=40085 RepID=A0A9N9WJA9_9NEOP|nr:unnamed protein product [Diatraea saccharalis]